MWLLQDSGPHFTNRAYLYFDLTQTDPECQFKIETKTKLTVISKTVSEMASLWDCGYNFNI